MSCEFKYDLTVLLWLFFIVMLAGAATTHHHIQRADTWEQRYVTVQEQFDLVQQRAELKQSVLHRQLTVLYENTLHDNAELMCLANNIFFEAGNQSRNGQAAVAAVTLNRVSSQRFPNTICEVVHQRNRHGCQFSWVCEDHQYVPVGHQNYRRAYEVAVDMLVGLTHHPLLNNPDALWYHADYVDPWWSQGKVEVSHIGNHIFYRADAR